MSSISSFHLFQTRLVSMYFRTRFLNGMGLSRPQAAKVGCGAASVGERRRNPMNLTVSKQAPAAPLQHALCAPWYAVQLVRLQTSSSKRHIVADSRTDG